MFGVILFYISFYLKYRASKTILYFFSILYTCFLCIEKKNAPLTLMFSIIFIFSRLVFLYKKRLSNTNVIYYFSILSTF